ncbi:DUF2206 domain-containing protein [Methanofollis aquaemaris]|uniref:DUF2206 domain-containing protein n=1 Tax=Methanofollis aquaemaris TaxID=126734 RepID=A0A8A3S850_9EURY|nr:DUF2206 domain-containing protein [Methanofollis aquaemaris]QSZ67891.1 DUF2206 domain-containing protein [Methanofollis aquaemaris]
MRVKNVFRLNDWDFRSFFIFVLSLQLALIGTFILDTFGLSLPFLREMIGFLYLTFVPGYLFLRIFRIHHLGNIETFLYAIGLSFAFLMFTGLFMNTVYPFFGIIHPITLVSVMITISVMVFFLCILAYVRDRTFSAHDLLPLGDVFSPPVLFFSLFPFVAIWGSYLMNHYQSTLLQMGLLMAIAIVPVIVMFTRLIPEKYYPYILFTLALALLFHTALITRYVWGWDIQEEFYLSNFVVSESFWDPTIYRNCNAMLSLVMLAPIYSLVLDMGMDWIFKILYPFFFALVPLGLYLFIGRQTNEKIAFLSGFFFMSIYTFYMSMPSLARQEIAELYLVIILLAMINQDLKWRQKSALFALFSVSLVVSHYGIAYLFVFILFCSWAIVAVESRFHLLDITSRILTGIQDRWGHFRGLKMQKFSFHPSVLPLNLVMIYLIFLSIWYIYTASSKPFDIGVIILDQVVESTSSELLSPDAAQGMAMITNPATTPLHEIGKYMHLLTISFIGLGFVATLFGQIKTRFDPRYLLFSFVALGLCFGGVALPYFASAINAPRLYQICLILLAPFCIIGGLAVLSGAMNRLGRPEAPYKLLSVFFAVFILFNCGWVYEVSHDRSTSFALNDEVDLVHFNQMEITGGEWLASLTSKNRIYADTYRYQLFKRYYGRPAMRVNPTTLLQEDDYMYLFMGTSNVQTKMLAVHSSRGVTLVFDRYDVSSPLLSYDLIYNNEGAEVYY